MDLLRLCGLGVSAALMAMLLRRMKPEFGYAATLGAGALMALLILPQVAEVVHGVAGIASTGGLSDGYVAHLLKICGISLLMDFAAQACRDAGESGLAMKVELAGRVTLMGLSLPFMQALLSGILSLAS